MKVNKVMMQYLKAFFEAPRLLKYLIVAVATVSSGCTVLQGARH